MTIEIFQESGTTPLKEHNGAYKVVLITPGQGTSGYYTEEVLRAYGPAAFPAGTHSYVEHPKKGEPRSPKNIIGVFKEDAVYEDNVGLVSYLTPFKHWKPFVEEVAPYTGMSIAAAGESEQATMDGVQTKLVKSLIPRITNTVDLVSYAGRGGHFAESLLESALAEEPHSESSVGAEKEGNENMALEEQVAKLITVVESLVAKVEDTSKQLESKTAEVAESAADASKAVDAVVLVEQSTIPESVKQELREGIKTGNYDVEPRITSITKLAEEILATAKRELQESHPGINFEGHSSSSDLEVAGW